MTHLKCMSVWRAITIIMIAIIVVITTFFIAVVGVIIVIVFVVIIISSSMWWDVEAYSRSLSQGTAIVTVCHKGRL